MIIEKFEDLEIWQLSRNLTKKIYILTGSGPFNKDFRFRDQIRASAGSVMDNIAEGFGRGGNKELINFLAIARGSNEETRSQLYRAIDNAFITQDEFNEAMKNADEITKKISSFVLYLKHSEYKGTRFMKEDESEYGS